MVDSGVTSVRGFDETPGATGVEQLMTAGLEVSGILMWSPGPQQTFPVADLAGFRRHVVEQVTRYKGRVRYWEVWNEPPNFTQDVSAASYAKIVAEAYDAAKSVDPDVQIGLCAKSVHVSFLAEAIDSGARNKFDFIALHPYEMAGLLPQGWEGPFLGIVPSVRAMLRDKNPERASVPVWFSEIGIEAAENGRPGVSADVQADTLLKAYTLGIAQGAAHIQWFDPRDSEGLTHGLLRADGTPRPAHVALTNLVRLLGKVPRYGGTLAPSRDAFGFLFTGVQGEVLVVWNRRDTTRRVQLDAAVDVVDPRTGTTHRTAQLKLSRAPLILLAPAGEAMAIAWRRNVRSGVPSWDGSPLARTAALVAGRTPNGIRMINPPPLKTVRGKPEFDLTGTDGARFAVDPAFLGYGAGPIRITAVVRGSGRGKPGFNLKYEYDGPLKAADDYGMVGHGSWNSLKGDRPVTLSWNIPDARFVGKYGTNFRIACDGPEFSDFSVLSVSVTKL